MNEMIKLILSLSLSGGIIAVILFALKPLVKHKLSKSIQYYLWLVVLLRLAVPFSFEGSVMNNIFYNNTSANSEGSHSAVLINEPDTGSAILPAEQIALEDTGSTSLGDGISNFRNLRDLFNDYALYLWLLGTITALTANLYGYLRFLKYIKQANSPASDEENRILTALLKGRNNVKPARNKLAATPMLIGVLRPYIIIPDIGFNEKQLKNILLHEITHFKRFDIGVKWLTMIAASIHWFNPLVYFVKKEVNHACELSCDEAVIKNLNNAEKQDYGDTLISVVAEHKYPAGVLQATMCEEKRSLKERLLAIMNHSKKSKAVIVFSAVLLVLIIAGAVYLGAWAGALKDDSPPNLYINAEYEHTKTAMMGTYSWRYKNKFTNADSSDPAGFNYKAENTVSTAANQQLIIGTQKIRIDKKYGFTLEEISVYKDHKPIEFQTVKPSFMNGSLYVQAPPERGEYVYVVVLNFKDRGTVCYGFEVRVDMPAYNLTEIWKYKTPYVGDNSKVSSIVRLLPAPDNYFKQQYISMITDNRPYRLNVYYEPRSGASLSSEWPIINPENTAYSNLRKNALILFSMIDNLDSVTFDFRNSQSKGKLDTSKYDNSFTFSRASIEKEYGDISGLGKNLDLLEAALNTDKATVQTP